MKFLSFLAITLFISHSMAAKLFILAGGNQASDHFEQGRYKVDGRGQFTYSIGARLDFSDGHSGFQLDFLYSPRITEYKFSPDSSETKTVHYIDIPLMYRIPIGRLSLGVGAYYSIGSGKIKHEVTRGASRTSDDLAFNTANHSDNDYGGIAAIGCNFKRHFVEARYLYGFSDRYTNLDVATYRVVQLLLGYRF